MLYLVAGMRRWRRSTLRYQVEEARISDWLSRVQKMAGNSRGYYVALEIAECQRLVKGYSDTHERGLKNYHAIMEAVDRMSDRPDLADVIKQLRNAALADDQGLKLQAALVEVEERRSVAA